MDITMTGASAPSAASDWTGSAAVYASAYRELLRVAYVLTGSGPVAEDVVHDVFAKVGPRIATLDDPVPYLRVAVVNRCRSLHRHTVRAPRPEPARDVELDVALAELRRHARRAPDPAAHGDRVALPV